MVKPKHRQPLAPQPPRPAYQFSVMQFGDTLSCSGENVDDKMLVNPQHMSKTTIDRDGKDHEDDVNENSWDLEFDINDFTSLNNFNHDTFFSI